jgi:hypothetical protein
MANPTPPVDVRKFTLTVIISFVILFVFSMLMMLWQGSYEKKSSGKINYNTDVVEPNSSF